MKKILLIGGSGFIGKSLINYVKSNKLHSYKFINYSRSSNKNILKINKLPNIDFILYLIKSNNIKNSLKYFNHFEKLLIKSPKNIKIMYFSSGAVYGPRGKYKKFKETENVNFNKILKFKGYKKNYAKEKIILERKFKEISNKGYKISIVRGFTFYGKDILKNNYLISEIINSVKQQKKLIIKNPYVIRSYMHSNDMSRWILKIIKYSSDKCPIYNLGSEKILNIEKFTNYLNKKYKSQITIKKNKPIKMDFYVPSVDLAKKKFKLKNTINFNHAIKQLIKYK